MVVVLVVVVLVVVVVVAMVLVPIAPMPSSCKLYVKRSAANQIRDDLLVHSICK